MYCPFCGTEIKSEALFCGICGKALEENKYNSFKRKENIEKSDACEYQLKRREYFKQYTDQKTNNKIFALNILSGMTLFVTVASVLYWIVFSILTAKVILKYFGSASGLEELYIPAGFFLVSSLISIAFIIFGLIYKHYGFYIPLLLFGLSTACTLAVMLSGNTSVKIMVLIICYILYISMIVLSVKISIGYRKCIKERKNQIGFISNNGK